MSDLTEQQVAEWLTAHADKLKTECDVEYGVLHLEVHAGVGAPVIGWLAHISTGPLERAGTLEEAVNRIRLAALPEARAKALRAQAADLLARASALEGRQNESQS